MFRQKSEFKRVLEWFADLSQGKFGLAKTFWLYYVIGSPVVFWSLNLVAILINLVPVDLVCFALSMAYRIVVLFGLWNAASRYKERNSNKQFWGYAAQIFVVFTGLGLANHIVSMIFLWPKIPSLYPIRPETYAELFQRLPQIIDMATRQPSM